MDFAMVSLRMALPVSKLTQTIPTTTITIRNIRSDHRQRVPVMRAVRSERNSIRVSRWWEEEEVETKVCQVIKSIKMLVQMQLSRVVREQQEVTTISWRSLRNCTGN